MGKVMRITWPVALAGLAALVLDSTGVFGQDRPDGGVVFREQGEASFYGPGFHNKPTASGETFDQEAMTAAHPKLPLGTEVTVTDQETGRQVEVEINDRGPYVDGRDIDLSQGAAEKLGITQQGVGEVTIEATERQVEEAIDHAEEAGKVQRQLEEARRAAAAEGTTLSQPLAPLKAPGR
jgi:rare lipoprotein A